MEIIWYFLMGLCLIGLVSAYVSRTKSTYKEGSRDFNPFGTFYIERRNPFNGSWEFVEKISNDYVVQTNYLGWLVWETTLTYKYPTESNWIEETVRLANILGDIRIRYHHYISDDYGGLVRNKVIWRNGQWID